MNWSQPTPWSSALPLVAALVLALSGCDSLTALFADEEIEEFRKQGMEEGQGLALGGEAQPGLAKPPPQVDPLEQKARKDEVPAGKTAAFALVWERLKCSDARCRQAASEQLRKLGPQGTKDLARIVRQDEARDVRVEAIRMLGYLRSTVGVSALLEACDTDDKVIRREAIMSLGQIGDPRAIPRLKRMLEKSERREEKEDIVQAFGGFDHPDAIAALVAAYDGASGDLRAAVVSALGRTGDPAAVTSLLVALEDDHHLVKVEAINALVQFPTPDVESALVRVAETAKDDRVRKRAMSAVAEINKRN